MIDEIEEDSSPEEVPAEEPAEPTPEEPLETPEKQEPAQQPDPELLNLYNSVRKEVGEKRFDGLMSAWQRDRRELLQLKEKPKPESKPVEPPKDAGDEAWLDYLDKRLIELRKKKEAEEDALVQQELKDALSMYPDLKEKEIVETAIKYSHDENNPIPLMSAARILMDLRGGSEAGKKIAAEELKRKKSATGISGKVGAEKTDGLRHYNPEKDKGKSFDELIEDAKQEIGIK